MNPPPLALVFAAAMAAAFALINPAHDTDLFWQATFGDLALAQRGPVRSEPVYPDALGRPIVPMFGLAQIWYALARQVGGWELVKLADAWFWAGAFFLPAWAAQRKFDPDRGWPSAVALIIGAFAASKFYMTRPQTFAMLGFGALLAVVLTTWPTRWKILAGSIVLVLWQNAHPSVVVGGMMLGLLAGVGWTRSLLKNGNRPWVETILAGSAGLAVVATPAGIDILQMMRENADRVTRFGLTEWLPVYHVANRGVVFPAIVGMAVTLFPLIVRGRRLEAGLVILALTLLGLTVSNHRFVVFFGIAAIPIWIQALASNRQHASARCAGWRTLIVLACLMTIAYGLLVAGRLPLWNSWLPLNGVAALKEANVKGAIFTNTQWGGLLTHLGDPAWHVTHDGRFYARTVEECDWYLAALRGEKSEWELEEQFHPVAFFLSPDDTRLVDRLIESGHWRILVDDGQCVVIVK